MICYERGIIFRINEHYKTNTIVICDKISHSFRGGLSVMDLFSAIFTLCVGVIVCCFAFVLEKVIHGTHQLPFEYEFEF